MKNKRPVKQDAAEAASTAWGSLFEALQIKDVVSTIQQYHDDCETADIQTSILSHVIEDKLEAALDAMSFVEKFFEVPAPTRKPKALKKAKKSPDVEKAA